MNPEPVETGAATTTTDTGADGGPWRSRLYPEDWAPGYATAHGSLRDFSHVGYRGGLEELPAPSPEGARSVLDFGADPTASADSTDAIQAAIDAGEGIVYLPEGRYRVDGRLEVRRSGTILMGDGSDRTELWLRAVEGLSHGANLTFVGAPAAVRSAELSENVAAGADRVVVASGAGPAVGDEVWLGMTITEDFVRDHGMEGYWTFSLNQWRPFFRRSVTEVLPSEAGDVVVLDVSLPYGMATRDDARMEVVEGYLEEVGLIGVGVSNAIDWDAAWENQQVHAVELTGVRDAFIRDVASFASPDQPGFHLQSGGIRVRNSRRVTVAESSLGHAQNRGEGGNGYLVEVRVSNSVLVRDTVAVAGRHNFIQNWDFGTSDLVFLRTHSAQGEAFTSRTDPAGSLACSETHHALAMAVLVDNSTVSDCWKMVNRLSYSSGAGHTATESVFWNVQGDGALTSHQLGRGYVIGTAGVEVTTEVIDIYESQGTAPEDFVEGLGQAASLVPSSLYEDQLARRRSR